jgi:hypothetical protein
MLKRNNFFKERAVKMNNIFNRVKILKSGEDCHKFSKSVSYETLVGGTATTGTGIKQTHRLSEGSADKPLDAVGTFSAFHNAEKVVEKILQMSPIFKLVKIISLAVLSISVVSESQAEGTKVSCINGLREDGVTACEKCGDNCNWSFDTVSGKLNVSGLGNMYDYTIGYENLTNIAPWSKYKDSIISVDVSGINSIGNAAFAFLGNIQNVNIGNSITKIGEWGFRENSISNLNLSANLMEIGSFAFDINSLNSVIIPDGVNDMTGWSFASNPIDELIIPDSVTNIEMLSLGSDFDRLRNMKIVCKGNSQTCTKIKELLLNYCYKQENGVCNSSINLSDNVKLANYKECVSINYFWNGAECVREPDVSKRKCCSSCKDMGGWCNRIRYTPAEAAQVLKDDNTNEVTITFKK